MWIQTVYSFKQILILSENEQSLSIFGHYLENKQTIKIITCS